MGIMVSDDIDTRGDSSGLFVSFRPPGNFREMDEELVQRAQESQTRRKGQVGGVLTELARHTSGRWPSGTEAGSKPRDVCREQDTQNEPGQSSGQRRGRAGGSPG